MKSYVISLHKRKDRLKKFYNNLPKDWPFDKPIKYKAIDGYLCSAPIWWNSKPGAWGCYKSHLNIIEHELNQDNKQNILIFEDDAIFCENFTIKMQEFLSLIPDDADQIYLGGQHLKLATNKGNYLLGNNINRTHCYIVTPKGLPILYKHLNDIKNWTAKMHIDHHYGYAHSNRIITAYAPKVWLVGQNQDIKSDINDESVKIRWWRRRKESL